MTSQIIIALGGLVLSVLTYFAGVQRTQKRLSKEARDMRIQKALDKYMGFRRSNYTGVLDGLKRAGVATLTTDGEIRELISLIVKHGESNPLGGKAHLFRTIDLKHFFDYAADKQIDFPVLPIEEVIKRFEKEA